MGRIKEISRKPARNRKRNPVVYLICEGSETEIRYFKRFRSRGCNIDIIPISSQYKSADRLVQKAKATMGNNPYYPDDGDSIWCVFDRDDNSNEVLLRAKQSAQKDFFDTLKPLQTVAVQRAKNRSEQIRNQGVEPISRQSNPLTTVYELVEYLNSKV